MIAPAWLKTPTQPIAADDAVAYLAAAPSVPESEGREVQIGGPDVLSYGEMLDRMALAMGRRPRPKLPVPVLTPWLSSLWIGLVTPVDAGVARPLVEGLADRDGGHRSVGRGPVRRRADGGRRGAPAALEDEHRSCSTLRRLPRAVAQPGSALRSGRRGPQFKSGQPDVQAATAL